MQGLRLPVVTFLGVLLAGQASAAGDLVPYRARYTLNLATTKVASSGVEGAGGVALDEWNESCGGWTEQEHFYLYLDYGADESGPASFATYSNLVTWEAEDARHFRFDMRRISTEEPYQEIKGDARLPGQGQGGKIAFTRPETAMLPLSPGTLFPSAHTRLLLKHAQAGDQLVSRDVFDGSEVESAGQITAVIGAKRASPADDGESPAPRPLLDQPAWPIRLAFFSTTRGDAVPDYEESLVLLDNGVVADMVLDYGNYTIHAKLAQIEPLPRPAC